MLKGLLLGNLWTAGLICAMLLLNRLPEGCLSARFRYCRWFLLPGSLLLPLLPWSLWPRWQSAGAAARQAFALVPAAGDSAGLSASGTVWLADSVELIACWDDSPVAAAAEILWLAGALLLAGAYLGGALRLHRWRVLASEPPREIQVCFRRCCQKQGLKRSVALYQSGFVSGPISFGCRRPCVLLPEKGMEGLTQQELEHVLLHELTHIRHGDLVGNWLFCAVQAACWWNPLVWAGLRRMRLDREAYCDWAVLKELAGEAERMDYGRTILRFAAGTGGLSSGASGFCQNGGQLKYRLRQVAGFRRETGAVRLVSRCAAGILALVALGQIPLLARCADYDSAWYSPAAPLTMEEADWSGYFGDAEGCALVYDQNADRYTVYNSEKITRRVPPCSTYKLYSALNALELGLITPEENTLAWDGSQYDFERWNGDQTLRSAMAGSVNWYFAALDRAVGEEKTRDFFLRVGYGDCRPGSDPDSYWNGSGLKISPLEQVELLRKLFTNEYGFDPANLTALRASMAMNDNGLYGKTGTGCLNGENIAGWFIGFRETRNNTYYFAVYQTSRTGTDGPAAYETAVNILSDMEIFRESRV